MGTIRKYLIAGLLVWLQLAATIIIISLVIEVFDQTILLLPHKYRPGSLLGFTAPSFGVVFALGVLIVTSMLVANLLGSQLVTLWEALLSRILLVRTIYNSLKQIAATILASDGKSFRKVVLVEYPRRETWSIGFLTNEDIDRKIVYSNVSAVFIPTTPNPTSGFIIMILKKDIIELDIGIEEGFKYIISMGVIVPEKTINRVTSGNGLAETASEP